MLRIWLDKTLNCGHAIEPFQALPEINDDGVQKSPTTRNEEQEETSSRRFTTESDNLAERQLEELQEYKNLRVRSYHFL